MNTLKNALHGWLGGIALLVLFNLFAVASRADEPGAKRSRWRTEAVRRCDVTLTVRASGTAEPEEVFEVNAMVPGMVTKFGGDSAQPNNEIGWNSKVDVGTALAYLDNTRYQNAVQGAQAKLKKSQAAARTAQAILAKAVAEFERDKARRAGAEISQSDVDSARLAVDVAKGNVDSANAEAELELVALKQAQADEKNTVLCSPLKGVVIDRRVNIGQTVGPIAGNVNSPSLFLIAGNLSKMQVWLQIDEADIAQIKVGQPVTFTTDAQAGKSFAGRVEQIRLNATRNQNRVTYTVIASIDNIKSEVLPYMTLTASIQIANRKNVLAVPNQALAFANTARSHWHDKRDAVYVPDGNVMRPIELKLGVTDAEMTEVIGGNIAEDTQVIVGE